MSARDVKSFGEEVCEYGFYNQGAMRSTNSSQLKNAWEIWQVFRKQNVESGQIII